MDQARVPCATSSKAAYRNRNPLVAADPEPRVERCRLIIPPSIAALGSATWTMGKRRVRIAPARLRFHPSTCGARTKHEYGLSAARRAPAADRRATVVVARIVVRLRKKSFRAGVTPAAQLTMRGGEAYIRPPARRPSTARQRACEAPHWHSEPSI